MPKNATLTMNRNAESGAGPVKQPAMLAVQDLSEMLNCSARTVYRLTDSGRIPRPVKLGALVRWPRKTIEQWINAGCPKR